MEAKKGITMSFMSVEFDDWVLDENGLWTRLCDDCVPLKLHDSNVLDESGSGVCGVLGCDNEADYYLDIASFNDKK